jgi:hypothetical protein
LLNTDKTWMPACAGMTLSVWQVITTRLA